MESSADTEILRLWEQQSREEQVTPLDDIRAKAERLDAKTRRWCGATTVLVILLVIMEAWQVWSGEGTLERAGDLLTIAAFLYVAYRYRKHRLAAPPVVLGKTTSVNFYRAELVRQRDLSKDGWGYLLPFVPGVALALLGDGFENRPTYQIISIVAFGVVLFLGVAWWNAHTTRRLEHEIDMLEGS